MSSELSWLSIALNSTLTKLPLYLTFLVGFIVALVYANRYPKVAIFVIAAMIISVMSEFGLSVAQAWLPSFMMKQGDGASGIGTGLGIIMFVACLAKSLAFALLFMAAFSQRTPAANQ